MNFKLISILAVSSVFALTGCVNPERVSESKLTDSNLTCQEIGAEMTELTKIRQEAAKGKGVSGANVAAVLIFPLAAVGNYMNAEQALEAADKREAVLTQISAQKNCSFVAG